MGTLSKTPIPGQLAEVTPVSPNINRLYDLHEYDPDKLITGEIDPNQIDPVIYPTYEKNYKGIVVIDKNKQTVSNQRTIINLTATKPSSKKFNEVVDTEIQEFTQTLNSESAFLSNQVAALDSSIQRSRSENLTLQKKITDLNSEIDSLRNQLSNITTPIENLVNDTLSAGKFLYASRRGNPGDLDYPRIGNMLLSKNRTARAYLSVDGGLVVYIGRYNERGEPLETETSVFSKGYDNSGAIYELNTNNSDAYAWINAGDTGRLEIGREVSPLVLLNNYSPGQRIINWTSSEQPISSAARLQLTDAGVLNLFDGANLIWSSYGA